MIGSYPARNRYQPAAKGRRFSQARELLHGFDEYVLHKIFGIVVGDAGDKNTVNQRLILLIELAESRAIPALRGANQGDFRLRPNGCQHQTFLWLL
jgi:hypothetical protein